MSESEHVREEGELSEDDEIPAPVASAAEIKRDDALPAQRYSGSSAGVRPDRSARGSWYHEQRGGRRPGYDDARPTDRHYGTSRNLKYGAGSPPFQGGPVPVRRREHAVLKPGEYSESPSSPPVRRGNHATKETVMGCSDHVELQNQLQNIRMLLASLQQEEEATTRKLQFGISEPVAESLSSDRLAEDDSKWPVLSRDNTQLVGLSSNEKVDEDIEELELRRNALLSAATRGQSMTVLADETATTSSPGIAPQPALVPMLLQQTVHKGQKKQTVHKGKKARKAAKAANVPAAASAAAAVAAKRNKKALKSSRRLRNILNKLEQRRNEADCNINEQRLHTQAERDLPRTELLHMYAKGHSDKQLVSLTRGSHDLGTSRHLHRPGWMPIAYTSAALSYTQPGYQHIERGDNYDAVAMEISQLSETPIVVSSSAADNYEPVSMDIDSESQSPSVNSPLAPADVATPPGTQPPSDEEEEVVMRQKLLKSLERRKAAVATKSHTPPPPAQQHQQAFASVANDGPAAVPETLPINNVSAAAAKGDTQKPAPGAPAHRRPQRWMAIAPVQKPVVITLDTSSSDEDELGPQSATAAATTEISAVSAEASHVTAPAQKSSLLSGIDMFLRQERHNAEKQHTVGSKAAVDGLPTDKQAEYSKLKAELRKRELALISKRELESEKRAEEKELAASKLKEALTRLSEKRVQFDASQSTLTEFADQITSRTQSVNSARARAAKLREQLAHADRVAAMAKQQLLCLMADRMKAQELVKKYGDDLQKLEAECKQLGKIAHGENYQLPPSAASGVKRSVIASGPSSVSDTPPTAKKLKGNWNMPDSPGASQSPLTVNSPPESPSKGCLLPPRESGSPATRCQSPSKGPSSFAAEKQRLLDLEHACAARLQELRDKKDSPAKLSVTPQMARPSMGRRLSAKLAERQRTQSVTTRQQPPTIDLDSDVIALATESSADEIEDSAVPWSRSSLLGLQTVVRPQLDTSVTSGVSPVATPVMPAARSGGESRGVMLLGRSSSKRGKRASTGHASGRAHEAKLQRILEAHCEKLPPVYLDEPSLSWHSDGPDLQMTCSKLSLQGTDGELRPTEADVSQFVPGDMAYVYESSLLQFKSYRLSPYYRTKSSKSLLSNTYANTIDARKIVCSYDLLGKCNDGSCKWQHLSSSSMSPVQVMQDLLLYCPSLAGATNSMSGADCSKQIEAFVSTFVKKLDGKMSSEEMCLLLVTQIRRELKLGMPYSIQSTPRAGVVLASADVNGLDTNEDIAMELLAVPNTEFTFLNDDVIGISDTRYFMLNKEHVLDIEQSLVDDPGNVSLWIKLAYTKLYDFGRRSSSEEAVDGALNILSRGLEKNHGCESLWLTYLNLFRSRKRSTADRQDYIHLCQQALCLAPSYETHWHYLTAQDSISKKSAAVDSILSFLANNAEQQAGRDVDQGISIHSHRIVEVLVYIVALYVQSGHVRDATRKLKSFLHHPSNDALRRCLTPHDMGFLWYIFIYVLTFRRWPAVVLFQEGDDNPGRLVCKQPFLFPWHTLDGRYPAGVHYDQLCRHLRRAIAECKEANEYELCLRKTYIGLMIVSNKTSQAEEVLQQWLASNPNDVDLWLELADIRSKTGDPEKSLKVIEEAIAANPTSGKLYGAGAWQVLENTRDSPKADQVATAVAYLERFARACFCNLSGKSSASLPDPVTLYRRLAREPVPIDAQIPVPLHNDGPDQKLDLWLNYCLLLELKDREQAKEAYETATLQLSNPKHLLALWKRYLGFLLLSSHKGARKEFWTAFRRCLVTIPTETRVPFPSAAARFYWTDYTFHNGVIDYVCAKLSEDVGVFLERCLRLMSRNVGLIKRGCVHAVKKEDLGWARWFCQQATQLRNPIASIDVWRMHARLLLKGGNSKEALQLLQKATRLLPYSVAIWKDYILCLVTSKSTQLREAAIGEVTNAGVNIQDFVDTLMPQPGL